MRFVVGICNSRTPVYTWEECASEEEMVLFIQRYWEHNVTMDINASLIVKPCIPTKSLVFNKNTLETRIVKDVCYETDTVYLYNSDDPEKVYRQENGDLPIIPENWNINDCIVIDSDTLKNNGFIFGLSKGQNKKIHQIEFEEFMKSIFD